MLHLGRVVLMRDTSSYNVTKATIGMIMHILGQDFDYDNDFTMLGCNLRARELLGYRREGWGQDDGSQLGAVGGGDGGGRGGRGGTPSDDYAPHLDLSRNQRIENETQAGGFPSLPSVYPHFSEKVPFHFPSIGVRVDFEELLAQFSSDAAFQNVVFEVLAEMFTPECVLSLVNNCETVLE